MAKIKNVSGEDRVLFGRLVMKDQVVDVDADDVYGLTCQAPNWEPADAEAKKAHNAALKAQVVDALDGAALITNDTEES